MTTQVHETCPFYRQPLVSVSATYSVSQAPQPPNLLSIYIHAMHQISAETQHEDASFCSEFVGGAKMPVIGLSSAIIPHNDRTVEQGVRLALEVGYRHFDTAKIYGSETLVGSTLKEEIDNGKVRREDVFVTSKLWGCDHHDPVSALKQCLRSSGLDYLDMYLVHWPVKLKENVYTIMLEEDDFENLDMESTWAGMEKCLEMGLCKCIGVSNFSCKKIEQLLEHASIPPSVNQVEMHPMWRQKKLRELCGDNKIYVSAYSPLGGVNNPWGTRAIADSPIIQAVALKHNATPAQIALSWGLSKGSSIITKSFNRERMQENLAALRLILDDEDILAIESLSEKIIFRGEVFANGTSPYKSIHELWDDEI